MHRSCVERGAVRTSRVYYARLSKMSLGRSGQFPSVENWALWEAGDNMLSRCVTT